LEKRKLNTEDTMKKIANTKLLFLNQNKLCKPK
jgi:hypothetical protein